MKTTSLVKAALVLGLSSYSLFHPHTVQAQVDACQSQVCDLKPGSLNPLSKPCFRCIFEEGSSCSPQGGTCPNSCLSVICLPEHLPGGGNGTKLHLPPGLPQCKMVLAQYRENPIPKPGEDHLQMTLYPGAPDDPLNLIGVEHDASKDLFSKGVVLNRSTQSIVQYRIGWIVYSSAEGKPLEREGRLKTLKPPLAPGASLAINAQGADPKESSDGHHNRIVFYIAEAVLADGTDWHPDLTAIEKKYQPATAPKL